MVMEQVRGLLSDNRVQLLGIFAISAFVLKQLGDVNLGASGNIFMDLAED